MITDMYINKNQNFWALQLMNVLLHTSLTIVIWAKIVIHPVWWVYFNIQTRIAMSKLMNKPSEYVVILME